MKFSLRGLFLSSLLLSNSIEGLPFKIRGHSTGGGQEDEDTKGKVADAIIESAAGTVSEIRVSKSVPGSRRNSVVESFFGSTNNNDNGQHSDPLKDEIHSRASDISEFLVFTRRALHRHPELMYNERETSAYVQNVLRELDIPFSTGWAVNTHEDVIPGPGGYGIVADIGTGESPCVLLRADMDALPILERTEGIDDFKSIHDGKMHGTKNHLSDPPSAIYFYFQCCCPTHCTCVYLRLFLCAILRCVDVVLDTLWL
jgi:hypothetical protein